MKEKVAVESHDRLHTEKRENLKLSAWVCKKDRNIFLQ